MSTVSIGALTHFFRVSSPHLSLSSLRLAVRAFSRDSRLLLLDLGVGTTAHRQRGAALVSYDVLLLVGSCFSLYPSACNDAPALTQQLIH